MVRAKRLLRYSRRGIEQGGDGKSREGGPKSPKKVEEWNGLMLALNLICNITFNFVGRYQTTGEIKAIRTEVVEGAYFQYDGPVLDHPAFPGVAQEHALRSERKHEAFAVAVSD